MVKKDELSVINGERKKKTLGRLKIEMQKIEKQSSRQVTFSKRKHGLFNKASQLCVLTGAEIAIIVQSLAGERVFTFGHKSFDSVIDRFLYNRIIGEENSVESTGGDYEKEYSTVCQQLAIEIKAEKGVVLNDDGGGGGFWWDREVEELELEELERYEAALVELMNNIETKANLPTMTIPTSPSSSSFLLGDGLCGFTGLNQAVDAYSNSFGDAFMVNDQMHEGGAAFDDYNPSFTYEDLGIFDVDHLGSFEIF